MKKGLKSVSVALLSVLALCGCGGSSQSGNTKFGFILLGDENEAYTVAHINGIKAAAKKLGIADEDIMMKKKVAEDDSVTTAGEDLVASGCSLIISNSYGHQDYVYDLASQYSDVEFVAATGDYAAIGGLDNFHNAFTNIYEARYISGIVGGMKLKQLIAENKLTDKNMDDQGNYKIGYVGAYTYAEVVSGYTAFYLGVKSIVDNVVMDVEFTDSWFDIDKESAAAENLVNSGCVIIGQHADSTGAPSKVESLLGQGKVCYSVGYNVDMLSVAPNAALTSSANNWEVYYEYAMKSILDGKELSHDWSEGLKTDAVGITALGSSCAEGTKEAVEKAEQDIKDGKLHVFDTSKFTVKGETVTEYKVDFSHYDFTTNPPTVIYEGETKNVIKTAGDTYYVEESTERSAPYFNLYIDGIRWTNKTM